MEALYRYISALAGAVAALFAPITPLICCTLLFIAIDFLTGVVADRRQTLAAGEKWYFESHRAWHTVIKATLAVTALAMAWLIDSCILDFMQLRLAHLFAGFTCGVELWSFLENAAQLSDAPLFRWLRQYVHRRIRREVGGE